jgi:hypothetical protein
MKMENKKCLKCGEDIHPKRLEILPNTNVCVKCSNIEAYKGEPIQLGSGDHCWNELLIKGKKENKIA